MLEDHEFHPRLGRLESRERAPKLFVAQVLAAAQLAGHVDRNWPARSPAGHTRAGRGRGGVAAWRAAERRLYGNRVRRVIVKARIVRQGFRAAGAVRAHLSYLRRDGVTKDGASARMFDAASNNADLRGFAERASDDRHHFRFIVSPEDATEMADLRAFTRDLVRQMEKVTGSSQRSPLDAAGSRRCLHFGNYACKRQLVPSRTSAGLEEQKANQPFAARCGGSAATSARRIGSRSEYGPSHRG
jgi:hypothetical protein